MERIFPTGLKQGDTIGIVAPAGPVDRARLQRGIPALESLGFGIKMYRDIYEQRGYLAGSDQQRADELMAAFRDPDCQAVFPARGGYGCLRIVDMLDYGDIRAHPKVFVGFSDNTVLHAAMFRQAGLVTFLGPHPSDSYGRAEGISELTAATLWQAIRPPTKGAAGYQIDLSSAAQQPVCHTPGVAHGRLVGGNLALVGALMGTPYEWEMDGKILFLEDVGEPPYRVDRLFAQLKAAGHLDRIQGLVLGQFTDCLPEGPHSLALEEVLDDFLTDLSCPVVTNFPSGHEADNATLPLQVDVELDANQGRLSVLEAPVVNQ